MSDGDKQKQEAYLAVDCAGGGMEPGADVVEKGDKRADKGQQGENRQSACGRRLLLPQTLNPGVPSEMQVEVPSDAGEKQRAYGCMESYP